MQITEIGENIKRKVRAWLANLGVKDVDVELEVPVNMDFGDLSLTIAFRLAKLLRKKPVEIARELARIISLTPYVDRVDVAGGGYINVFLNRPKFYEEYLIQLFDRGIDYFRPRLGGGLVKIEYTSVNPNKAIHIGHARNIVLGAALRNMFLFGGYDVELLNYIDDTGSQMADLLIGFLYLGYSTEKEGVRFDKYCGDVVYRESYERIEASDELKSKRRNILRMIEEGNNVVASFNRMIAERVLREQLRTCWRLGADYDKLIWESDLIWSGIHKRGYELIRDSKLVMKVNGGKYDGCLVAKLSEGEEINPEVDDVLVRSDGTLTYLGKDVVFALWKLGLLDFPLPFKEFVDSPFGRKIYSTSWPDGHLVSPSKCNLSINIIGVEQSKPQRIIKEIIRDVFGDEASDKYIHYYYSHVWISPSSASKYLGIDTGGKPLKMSGRRGIYFNVDDILEHMVDKAKRLILLNNPGMDEGLAGEIAERIAVASLKFMLLGVDRDKIVVFDIDKALDVSEESGAYVLYSYARAHSIYRKALDDGWDEKPYLKYSALNDYDRYLLRYMAYIPIVINNAIKRMEPKDIVNAMLRLSQLFNEFYEHNPVLKEVEEVRLSRLSIIKAFLITMEALAHLVDIPLTDRM